jgi:transposase
MASPWPPTKVWASPGVADSREVGTLVSIERRNPMGKIYPEEVKKKAVQLYRLDPETTYAEVGRDLGISGETIRNWCRQAARDEGRLDDGEPTSEQRAELAQLRRDNARLEKEVRILKSATAYFAKDQL